MMLLQAIVYETQAEQSLMKRSMKVSFIGKIGKVYRPPVMNAIAVASKLINVPAGLEIYVAESPQKFHLVLRQLPHATQNVIKNAFSLKKISFSTWFGSRKIIVLMLHRAMLKNSDALIGLLLHEMTHIKQQDEGLADGINRSFQEVFLTKVARLHHPLFSRYELIATFIELGLISTLLLRDLYATTKLIEGGYENYVIAHYKSRFSDKKLCPAPINRRRLHRLMRQDLAVLVSSARFEAYVAAVLLPLRRIGIKKARELRQFVGNCYSTQVSDCEVNCRQLIHLYAKEFSYSAAFRRKFFNIMFAHFVKMLG